MGESATRNMAGKVPPFKQKSQSLIGKIIASLQLPLEVWELTFMDRFCCRFEICYLIELCKQFLRF